MANTDPQEAVEAAKTQEPKPGVVLTRLEDDEGNIGVAIDPVGGLDPLAIPALLRGALKVAATKWGGE